MEWQLMVGRGESEEGFGGGDQLDQVLVGLVQASGP
jgi:hypothetical protein